jgi:protein-disulfide isomerase
MSGELESPHLAMPVGKRDHVRGDRTAPLMLVEYGDYECPYCGAAYPIVAEVRRILGDQLRFVFRNFPLTEVHPHALQAAEAAEAASPRGRFWEMHDLLFENQKRLRTQDLLRYAQTLGLDTDRVEADLAEHTYEPRIREDVVSGARSGVNGTPTFFVNGVRHDGGYDLETLLEALGASR